MRKEAEPSQKHWLLSVGSSPYRQSVVFSGPQLKQASHA